MATNILNINQIPPVMQCHTSADDAAAATFDIPTLVQNFKGVKYVSIAWEQFGAPQRANYNAVGLMNGSKFSISEQVITSLMDWGKTMDRLKITKGHLLEVFKLPGVGAENGLRLYALFCGFGPIAYDFAAVIHALYELDREGHTMHTMTGYRYAIQQLPVVQAYTQNSAVKLDTIVEHVRKIRDLRSMQLGVTTYIAAAEDIQVEKYFANLQGCQIITGGGGTGKTTTVVQAVEHFAAERRRVMILTPTNKAKAVLLDRLPDKFGHMVFTVDSYAMQENYEVDVLIIDECSMLTNYHFRVIMDKPAKLWTYLVGDPQQLPPVGTGALFAGLIQKKLQPITLLEKNYRTEASDILDMATSVMQRGSIPLTPSASIKVIAEPDYDEMVREPDSHIITHTRAVTKHVNKIMLDLARHYGIPPKFKYMANDSAVWYRNRMVVRKGAKYYDADTDEYLEKGDSWADHHLELGFCTTIHTAQGGGWNTIYLILNLADFRSWPKMEKELLYTAITRAKKRLVIITTHQKMGLKRYPRNTLISGGMV